MLRYRKAPLNGLSNHTDAANGLPTSEDPSSDDGLYGTGYKTTNGTGAKAPVTEENVSGVPTEGGSKDQWCCVVRQKSVVEIRRLPSFQVVWRCSDIGSLPNCLTDTTAADAASQDDRPKAHDVLEVLLFAMKGPSSSVFLAVSETVSAVVVETG